MPTRFITFKTALIAVWTAFAAPLAAQDSPVVVELFTSQGCSSCPPADSIMHELAKRDDVIALALHVDYWDYIGWKDEFADAAYTKRQRKYAVVGGRRSIYTPQMIINGHASVVGARAMEIADTINAAARGPMPVSLVLTRTGDTINISAPKLENRTDMVIHMVRYIPKQEVRITRGENAGRNLSYSNIAQNWRVLDEWNGRRELNVNVEAPGDLPVVVLVQASGQGKILGAARLR